MTILHLIRHGRASALEADYDQLQPLGELQARLLGGHLAERRQRYDAVYVGPLKRQRETWRSMREAAGAWAEQWPEAHVLDGLAEGPFEALMKSHLRPRIKVDATLQELLARSRAAQEEGTQMHALQAMFDRMIELWRGGQVAADDLETAAAFLTRVEAARDEIARREGPGRQVAVITSNGVIGELLRSLAGAELDAGRLRFHNTSVSVIELHADGPRLHGQNATPHLQAEHLTLL